MEEISIAKVKKIISQIVRNRWEGTKIIDKGDTLLYDIQHKFEKVSYSVTFEKKGEVMNMTFRSSPYEREELAVNCDFSESLRFDFLQTERRGITGICMEFEEGEGMFADIPVIRFDYWICLDMEEDALIETMKTLLEVIVPNDCIQLIKYLRNNPQYLE